MPKRKRGQGQATPSRASGGGQDITGELKDPTGDSRSSGENRGDENGILQFKIPFNDKQIVCERHPGTKSADGNVSLIFTHGAGGGIENPATKDFVTGFASAASNDVICFQGTMNPKHRTKTFHAVIENQGRATALGGRSMGARAAVITATECDEENRPEALILVSYPLGAGAKQTKKQLDGDARKQILLDLPADIDVLFVIGSEDIQCSLRELGSARKEMKARSWLMEVKNGDHGMGLKPKAGMQPVRQRTGALAARWLKEHGDNEQYSTVSWDEEKSEVVCSDWHSSSSSPSQKKRKK
jgi:predicted alpha/beta-hydrolase family hydrolase